MEKTNFEKTVAGISLLSALSPSFQATAIELQKQEESWHYKLCRKPSFEPLKVADLEKVVKQFEQVQKADKAKKRRYLDMANLKKAKQ